MLPQRGCGTVCQFQSASLDYINSNAQRVQASAENWTFHSLLRSAVFLWTQTFRIILFCCCTTRLFIFLLFKCPRCHWTQCHYNKFRLIIIIIIIRQGIYWNANGLNWRNALGITVNSTMREFLLVEKQTCGHIIFMQSSDVTLFVLNFLLLPRYVPNVWDQCQKYEYWRPTDRPTYPTSGPIFTHFGKKFKWP